MYARYVVWERRDVRLYYDSGSIFVRPQIESIMDKEE